MSSTMSGPSLGADLVGDSPQFRAVLEKVRRILERGPTRRRLPPILIQGETGTGKGILARAIWRAGARSEERFVEVNCAAIPETLLEAELFGFERGAFTGAREPKPGLFQEAHRGTLFLDEVGLLPEAQQAKLLTVVEEGAVRRLGRTRSEAVDAWILSASSEDLHAAVREHRFREDLYHRLAVVTLSLPPLRERGSDILLLAERFLARDAVAYALPPKTLAPDARAALLSYCWPGNIRELANVIERVALLAEGRTVTAEVLALPYEPAGSSLAAGGGLARRAEPGRSAPAHPEIAAGDQASGLTAERVGDALRRAAGNVSRAAKLLGVTRNTLRYRIEKHQIRPGSPTPSRSGGNGGTGHSQKERRNGAHRTGGNGSLPTSFRWEQRHLALLLVRGRGPTASFAADAAQLFDVVERKVENFGGRVIEIGRSDGSILAAFGLDILEDAPARAALAAMAIRKSLEDGRAARDRGDDRDRAAVCLALHVAPLDVGRGPRFARIDRDAGAAASSLLDGLSRREPAGAIVISPASRDLLARKFALHPASQPGAWLLVSRKEISDPQTSAATRFVGRDKPLELLRSLLEKADAGQGQIVGITGEPGIGKSRLFLEFRRAVRERGINYIGAHCESHTAGIPFFPVIKLIQASCGLTEADTPETTADKVSRNLDSLGIDGAAASPYLLKLLGVRQSAETVERLAALSSRELNARTFEVLWEMIWTKNGRPQPLVIGVEDAHWIDRASEGYFRGLAERLSPARVFFLLTYRSGYRQPVHNQSFRLPWTEIALEPLTPDESRAVMDGLVQREEIPEPLAETILARAEGNPFFLEELALSVGTASGSEPAAVPGSIRAALEARFDRLEEAPRRLLETAAILGREVSLRVLRKLWNGDGPIESHLPELARHEFLTPKRADEATWVFKHPLIQEAAYERLELSDRRALHGAAGHALETFYAGRLEEAYDRLAYHYSKSDELESAVEYLSRLADKAARSNALAEAVSALQEASTLAEKLGSGARHDVRAAELLLRRAQCLSLLGRLGEARALLSRERARFDASPEPSLRSRYLTALSATQRPAAESSFEPRLGRPDARPSSPREDH
jgi:DNA-binding NtrC family response regulator